MEVKNPKIVLTRNSEVLVELNGELKLVTLKDEVEIQLEESIDIENPEIHDEMLKRAVAASEKFKKKEFDNKFLLSLDKQFKERGSLSQKQKIALEKVFKKLEVMCKKKDIDIHSLV